MAEKRIDAETMREVGEGLRQYRELDATYQRTFNALLVWGREKKISRADAAHLFPCS